MFTSTDKIDLETFQSQFWRRRAVVLGQVSLTGLGEFGASDLLELAQQDDVESRVIAAHNDGYELTLGPFDQADLGPTQMLMVQNLESFLPEVSLWLSESFQFLARWRIEDVMATLAHSGSNCGAHYDQYDVFLVQVHGEKHWSLDDGGHQSEDLVENSDIRLLANFEPTVQLEQRAGDILYIPPGVGHHGIASDDSLTLSVGIRNPLLAEMASYLADMLLQSDMEQTSLNDRLTGSLIESEEIAGLSTQLQHALTSPGLISNWYGTYMTEPRDPELLEYSAPPEDLPEWLERQTTIELQLPARIAVQSGMLFVNGEAHSMSPSMVQCPEWLVDLQQKRSVPASSVAPDEIELLEVLIQCGAVIA